MKPSHDDTILRRTLQEIYDDYPQSGQDGWEQEVMRKISVTSVPHKETPARKRTAIGWWVSVAAVAAVGVLLLTVTFWPQSDTEMEQLPVVAQTDMKKKAPTLPIEEERVRTERETPVEISEPREIPKETEQTTSVPSKHKVAAPKQEKQETAEVAQETQPEALPPYERPRIQRGLRSTQRQLRIVTEEALRNINDFSLAAYDRLSGIEVGQPQPEEITVAPTEPTVVRVSQRMSATAISALSQDQQHRKLALVNISN